MPEQRNPIKLADHPTFLDDLRGWGAGDIGVAPDPRVLNREDEEFMRLLKAMLGEGGYMQYVSALNKQRSMPGAQPSPTPMPIQPTPTPMAPKVETVGDTKGKTEDIYNEWVGGRR